MPEENFFCKQMAILARNEEKNSSKSIGLSLIEASFLTVKSINLFQYNKCLKGFLCMEMATLTSEEGLVSSPAKSDNRSGTINLVGKTSQKGEGEGENSSFFRGIGLDFYFTFSALV